MDRFLNNLFTVRASVTGTVLLFMVYLHPFSFRNACLLQLFRFYYSYTGDVTGDFVITFKLDNLSFSVPVLVVGYVLFEKTVFSPVITLSVSDIAVVFGNDAFHHISLLLMPFDFYKPPDFGFLFLLFLKLLFLFMQILFSFSCIFFCIFYCLQCRFRS